MKIYKKQKLTASVFLYNKYMHCGNKSKAVFLLRRWHFYHYVKLFLTLYLWQYLTMKDLLTSKFEFFTFFELTPDLVCIAGRDGFFRRVNHAVINKLGYTEEELFAVPISTFIYEEDKLLTHRNRQELLSGKVLHNFINRYVTKTGEILWLEWTSIYFSDNEMVLAIAKDCTERKRLEKDAGEKYQKFKSLATYFKSNVEKGRKDLTYGLHEELAQLVSAITVDVELIATCEPDLHELSKKRIEHALGLSKSLIKTLQRISFTISPYMLEELGLNETLKWLCREFSILSGIPCNFESAFDEKSLTHEIKIDFFRICQESLSNIIDHAKAARAFVSIEEKDGNIELKITDNGKGFKPDEQKPAPGLTSMRERAGSINGRLSIRSSVGAGTTICISIANPATGQQ